MVVCTRARFVRTCQIGDERIELGHCVESNESVGIC